MDGVGAIRTDSAPSSSASSPSLELVTHEVVLCQVTFSLDYDLPVVDTSVFLSDLAHTGKHIKKRCPKELWYYRALVQVLLS